MAIEKVDQSGDLLEARFGGRTVRENLDRAVARDALGLGEDGRWSLPPVSGRSWYLQVKFALPLECRFLNEFVFRHAYAGAAVPAGCRACFKVKVVPPDFRGLIALRGLLEAAPYHSKCGMDFFNPYSRDFYAGYLYLDGLDAAREARRDIADRIAAHPRLGPSVPVSIKRGCSNYEEACGPSDQWRFAAESEAIESRLKERFHATPVVPPDYRRRRAAMMVQWLQVAYSLKDDTYLDFTGGKPLHRAAVTYPAEAGEGPADPSSA